MIKKIKRQVEEVVELHAVRFSLTDEQDGCYDIVVANSVAEAIDYYGHNIYGLTSVDIKVLNKKDLQKNIGREYQNSGKKISAYKHILNRIKKGDKLPAMMWGLNDY